MEATRLTSIPEPYVLVTRKDLVMAHLMHRNGSTCLCAGASAEDWVKVQAGEKPCCSVCLQNLEDRDGGRSGMGRAG